MWEILVLIAISFAVSYFLAKKPKSYDPEAETEIDAPMAEEGGTITVLFGTKRIKNPNVVWWGDLKTTAIEK